MLLQLDCLLQLHSEGPRRNVRALFIGDSITCGFADFSSDPDDSDGETPPLPRGCWDTYPYVTENLMRTRFGIADFETEISAYPGATLVVAPPRDEDDGEEEDVSEEVGPFDTNCALSKKFFHVRTNNPPHLWSLPTPRTRTSGVSASVP